MCHTVYVLSFYFTVPFFYVPMRITSSCLLTIGKYGKWILHYLDWNDVTSPIGNVHVYKK